MKKKLLIVLICIAVVLSVFACLLLMPNSKILDIFGRSIKVGIAENPPFSYTGSAGDATGFSCDIASLVFEKLNYKVKFVTIKWEDREELLKKGKIDCFMDSTGTVSDNFILSRDYVSLIQGTFFSKDKNIELNSAEDLSKYTCGYISGSSAEEFLAEQNAKGISYPSASAAAEAAAKGKVDLCIIDSLTIDKLIGENDDYKNFASGILLFNEDRRIAFRSKDSALKQEVDKQIIKLAEEGRIRPLTEHYGLLGYTA